jgi:hypothetical protein
MHIDGNQYSCDQCGNEFEGVPPAFLPKPPGMRRADICPECAAGLGTPPSSPYPGASMEVIEEHAARHPCGDQPTEEHWCPCSTTVVIVCTKCGDAVFASVAPGSWCEHAAALTGLPQPGPSEQN